MERKQGKGSFQKSSGCHKRNGPEGLQRKNIQYLVAPFEADAQLPYLSLKGFAQLVISEDSDLLVFGCKQFQVLYKMRMNGTEKLIKKCDLNKSLKLKEFTFEKFRLMCILSGCDYASSLRGIGFTRAKQVVEMAGSKGMSWALHNIREILKMPTLIVPESYFEKFFFG
ncbi:exonuclease 1-like [Orbicella faveolata]|uniref:exonuclease 1-like n=1 Tax=Orbicella faveolata TaxID=48498 RepID=UPI0009E27AD3|nr:exonuclease 1-like [Orbicella faveolata]